MVLPFPSIQLPTLSEISMCIEILQLKQIIKIKNVVYNLHYYVFFCTKIIHFNDFIYTFVDISALKLKIFFLKRKYSDIHL
ncbi:hypothetical protein MHTCC0001_22790 [Flavobacteriaceae bacterium MHTCC 0001]